MENDEPACMECADMDHLVFLPSGDAALTRRAKRASRLSAVVVRFSRARKRYERQGILVEADALERAEAECLADAPARARRRERDVARRESEDLELQTEMAEAIASLYPGCPRQRTHAIARHAATRGSGRVGRSAAGRDLQQHALELAVSASLRHQDTPYDALLMSGISRTEARELVRDTVEDILSTWQTARTGSGCSPQPRSGPTQPSRRTHTLIESKASSISCRSAPAESTRRRQHRAAAISRPLSGASGGESVRPSRSVVEGDLDVGDPTPHA